MTAHFQTVMIQKINRALAKIAAENLTAFIAADFSGGGDLFQIDGFTVVAVNIGNHIALDQKTAAKYPLPDCSLRLQAVRTAKHL